MRLDSMAFGCLWPQGVRMQRSVLLTREVTCATRDEQTHATSQIWLWHSACLRGCTEILGAQDRREHAVNELAVEHP
jgi:hypothetical protein